ncbi:hypothetical protein V6N13_124184 [Hibiscus sabdariffa]|uniref:Uncharacterized protein n=1 Tax=Hibiscus sabdariffa TaxID=183260 RepID=A0ABR2S0M0_9ROSI
MKQNGSFKMPFYQPWKALQPTTSTILLAFSLRNRVPSPNMLDAMDYSMLNSFLADNQCNTIGYESSYFDFRNIEQTLASSNGSRLLQKLP